MRSAESQTAVDTVILHDVADILYTVLPAPLPDRAGKILRI
jgi:hypothetical protein